MTIRTISASLALVILTACGSNNVSSNAAIDQNYGFWNGSVGENGTYGIFMRLQNDGGMASVCGAYFASDGTALKITKKFMKSSAAFYQGSPIMTNLNYFTKITGNIEQMNETARPAANCATTEIPWEPAMELPSNLNIRFNAAN